MPQQERRHLDQDWETGSRERERPRVKMRPEESRSPGSKGGPITTDHGLWIWITDKC